MYTTVNVRNQNTFGFQTPPHLLVQITFEQTELTEIRTICSAFGCKFATESRTWSFERSDFGRLYIRMPIPTFESFERPKAEHG